MAQGAHITQGWHRGHSSQGWHRGQSSHRGGTGGTVHRGGTQRGTRHSRMMWWIWSHLAHVFHYPAIWIPSKTSFAIWKHVFVQHADDSKISLGCLRWVCIRMYITESSTHRNLQNIFWRDTNLFLWSNCVYSVFAKRGEKNNEINFPKYKYSLLWRHN